MLTSSSYLTCGLKRAHVQSLGIQPLRKQGQRWLRLSPSELLETYSKHAICQMKMDIWKQCDRRAVDLLGSGGHWVLTWAWLLAFLPRALLTAPCPLKMTVWHWSFSGQKPLWDQNDTHRDKHYPVPLLPLPDSSEWDKGWVCAQNSVSVFIFSFKVW